MANNPFGDEGGSVPPSRPANPFGDDDRDTATPAEAAASIEHAAARIRRLKGLVGAEGLTASATRELMDHLNDALRAMARALRGLDGPGRAGSGRAGSGR
ncbi:MAG TPA: hypothetical protein VMM12_00930 [Longimicrobiales bacterium]|nr:hypothetical protein [Longimicrobiales bacterium]